MHNSWAGGELRVRIGGACGPSYPDSFSEPPKKRGFTGIGAMAAQWETLPHPLERTMAPRALYQRLCQQLQACMPDLGVWPTRRLALIVTGLLLARHAALPRLAAQLRRVTPGAQADSIERRLRRILAHTEWDTTAIFEAFARASLRHLPRGRCVLLLDDTQQTDHCTLSTLALAYGGRALPLAWCRWSGQLEGQYWQQIDQLFEQATRILPPHVQPVLLADRGLASPKLIKLVRQRGWD